MTDLEVADAIIVFADSLKTRGVTDLRLRDALLAAGVGLALADHTPNDISRGVKNLAEMMIRRASRDI